MTRYGSTPYLQSVFTTNTSISASKTRSPSNGAPFEPIPSADLGLEDGKFYYADLKKEGFLWIKLVFESVGKLGIEEYLNTKKPKLEELKAGVLAIGSTSRLRKCFNGVLSFNAKEEVFHVRTEVDLFLDDLFGVLTLEPVVVVAEEVSDPINFLKVTPGTIIASSKVTEVMESARELKFGDLFQFEWLEFAESESYETEETFDIDFVSEPPRIILNESIKNFHHVLDRQDNPKGRQPKTVIARRNLDASIATGVLMVCGAAVISKIRAEAAIMREEDPSIDDFGEVFNALTNNEKQFIQGFRLLMSIEVDNDSNLRFCDEIAKASVLVIRGHLSSGMLKNIQRFVKTETSVYDVLELAGFERD